MTSVLKVNGMGCSGCINTIQTHVGEIAGVAAVSVDLEKSEVTVEMDQANILDKVKKTIEEHGYKVVQ